MTENGIRILTGRSPEDYPSRRVAVAMSGGVDSSVAAALLAEAGFETVGLTMMLWTYDDCGRGKNERGCCDRSTADDARRAASVVGIPHYTVNLRDAFEREVIEDFVSVYLSGRTPNPCVHCNTRIKWRAFRAKALALGCELIATGHYARIGMHPDGTRSLLTGVDASKDQSYFLWGLGSGDLAATLFPLGHTTKEETRAEALRRGLPTAHRTESQEICFITDDDYGRFLRHRLDGSPLPPALTPGKILDRDGRVLGEHPGAAYYTVGQRRGLGIALGRPAYVVGIDAGRNTVTVGDREDLLSEGMLVSGIRWTRGFPPADSFSCTVRIRYRNRGVAATVLTRGNEATVAFESPQSAVTPGQSAVFYDGDIVLGGGFIERPVR